MCSLSRPWGRGRSQATDVGLQRLDVLVHLVECVDERDTEPIIWWFCITGRCMRRLRDKDEGAFEQEDDDEDILLLQLHRKVVNW